MNYCRVMVEAHWCASFQMHPPTSRWVSYPGALDVVQMMSLESIRMWYGLGTGLTVHWRTWCCRSCEESDAVTKKYLCLQWSLAAWQDYCSVQNKWHQVENRKYFIHSIWLVQNAMIPCHSQELLPFLSVIYFFLSLFSTNYSSILPHFILPSICWSASVLLFPNSYTILYWEFYFLPFSVHVQTNVIYVTLLSLLW
jgi:hypothetical protein